jgi:hypothetical protein
MFETPNLDIQDIRTALTEAGHTAAGFATLAVKRAVELRADVANRYEDQIMDLRKQTLAVVNRVEAVRADVEATVEPLISRVVDRLPAPAAKVVYQVQDATKDLQARAHDFVVSTLTVDDVPAAKQPTATAAKTTATKVAATTAMEKNTTKKNTTKKNTAKKTASAKAQKAVAKKTAPTSAKKSVKKTVKKTAK